MCNIVPGRAEMEFDTDCSYVHGIPSQPPEREMLDLICTRT
jgi:hypothetical protein